MSYGMFEFKERTSGGWAGVEQHDEHDDEYPHHTLEVLADDWGLETWALHFYTLAQQTDYLKMKDPNSILFFVQSFWPI